MMIVIMIMKMLWMMMMMMLMMLLLVVVVVVVILQIKLQKLPQGPASLTRFLSPQVPLAQGLVSEPTH